MGERITVGIPAFHAESHITDCISSIQIQSIKDDVEVIIAKDNPTDNYDFLIDRFPDLNITILECAENGGPGIARQRCADAATTNWITWIDADDVFFSPFALESLQNGITKNCVEVQGVFYQELDRETAEIQGARIMPMANVNNPWVFARLYNIPFLRNSNLEFSSLRAIN